MPTLTFATPNLSHQKGLLFCLKHCQGAKRSRDVSYFSQITEGR